MRNSLLRSRIRSVRRSICRKPMRSRRSRWYLWACGRPPAREPSASTSASAAPDSVANMSLSDKVVTTAKSGIASAAKDAGGAVGTFLKDPKNAAMLATGTGTLVAAQAVLGLDVGVDATLGVVGAAMYASAAPSTARISQKRWTISRITSAKSAARRRKPTSTRPQTISPVFLRPAARKPLMRSALSPARRELHRNYSASPRRPKRWAASMALSQRLLRASETPARL